MAVLLVDGYSVPPRFSRTRAVMVITSSRGSYEFDFSWEPVELQYEKLAAEMVEIERPGRFSLNLLKKPNLAQVTMEYVIADRPSGGLNPIDDQLDRLRVFGVLGGSVQFYNFRDYFLSNESAVTAFWGGDNIARWSLTDLSVTTRRRNEQGFVTQALVRMTLTEERNPEIAVVALPGISYTDAPSRDAPRDDGSSIGGGGGLPCNASSWFLGTCGR